MVKRAYRLRAGARSIVARSAPNDASQKHGDEQPFDYKTDE
jgi:hypothetical protein